MSVNSFSIKGRVKIFNEDCLHTLSRMKQKGVKVDFVLTSPPYNTANQIAPSTKSNHIDYRARYDIVLDNRTDDEYIQFTLDIFNLLHEVLSKNGAIAWNLSYSTRKPYLIWQVVSAVCTKTPFVTADCIVWKKHSAFPDNNTPNRLSRLCEFVFIFCRKDELDTFHANKKVSSTLATGQKRYHAVSNFITAKNNDSNTAELNKATFSTDFAMRILRLYAPVNGFVYDPFIGTGTTAIACLKIPDMRLKCYGSELSSAQCQYAVNRLEGTHIRKTLFGV